MWDVLSRIRLSPGHSLQIIPPCVPTARQAWHRMDRNTYLLNELVASLTVVKVGREGLNFGTKREISCADLREHSRVRKEGTAQSIPEQAL